MPIKGTESDSTDFFSGVKVFVLSRGVSHFNRKLKIWQTSIPRLGGQVTQQANASGITHIAVGEDPGDLKTASLVSKRTRAVIVRHSWIEACLAQRCLAHVEDHSLRGPSSAKPVDHSVHEPKQSTSSTSRDQEAGVGPAVSEKRQEFTLQRQGLLQVSDVQNVILWAALDGPRPPWVSLPDRSLVKKVAMIFLSGIDRRVWVHHKDELQLEKLLGTPLPVKQITPTVHSSQTARKLLTVQGITGRKRKLDEGESNGEAQAASELEAPAPFPISIYLATFEQMAVCGYPVPIADAETGGWKLPDGYEQTEPREGDQRTEDGFIKANELDIVSLDCEMCYTSPDKLEVTRASLVDAHGQTLLDELVLPDAPITNYNTQFSGITPSMMAGVQLRLPALRRLLKRHIKASTILVGHALENDLEKLKLVHLNNIDTAMLYPHALWPAFKHSLSRLAKNRLQRVIQDGSHDSVVDAVTTLDLANLKMLRGPQYGAFAEDSQCLFKQLKDAGRRVCVIDSRDVLSTALEPGSAYVETQRDSEAASAACSAVSLDGSYDFIWARFSDISNHHELRASRKAWLQRLPPNEAFQTLMQQSQGDDERLRGLCSAARQHVADVVEAAAPGTLLIFFTGQGNTAETRRTEKTGSDWSRNRGPRLTGLGEVAGGGAGELPASEANASWKPFWALLSCVWKD